MKIVLVAAIGENNVIGRDGQLPWRLKSDLQAFPAADAQRPVIMGRKTYRVDRQAARQVAPISC